MTPAGYGARSGSRRMLRVRPLTAVRTFPAAAPKERQVKIQNPAVPPGSVPEVDWDHLRRAAVASCRHIPQWVSRDDLVQEASLAGWRAASRWRPDGGSGFTPFVTQRAVGAVRDVLREHSSSTRSGHVRPVDVPFSQGHEPATNDRDTVLDIDLHETLERALGRLSPRQRHVIVERFLQGRVSDDIGRDLGITGSAVSLLVAAALKRLSADGTLRDWVGLAA
ncbi:MAG: sigma factor [Actinomycetota bacterium]|jgi:RNA polymerase sigma factor (sigma-70 family)|nr:sigma factor [Actinomycetota bacterium]